ncbi:MAG: DUF2505 family protein [Myxococcota bacterium]
MATSSTYTFVLDDVPLDVAVDVLSSDAFDVAQQQAQEGTASASVKVLSRDDNTFVYELHAVEYAKGVRGLDKSKTENTVTRVTWDFNTRKSRWEYEGPQGKRVRVWGGTSIEPRGQGSVVTTDFNIEVKIPLVGGQIEKLVVRASTKHMQEHFEPLARTMCQERLAG